MAITTASQSQLGQDTAKNSQVVTTVIKNFNSGTLGSGPSITSVVVTDSSYNTLDDTAVTTSNGYIKIIGTGFTSTANVYIGSSAVPAANVTFVSSTEIRARVPVLSVGNYSLSLFNSNSSGTISSSTFIVSTGPAWVTGETLSNQAANTFFGVNLSATSDTSVTYANTSALPAGTTLAANGFFSGTVSIGAETTYTFDVKATDVENQDASRTFSLTVTVVPPYNLYSWGRNQHGQLALNNTTDRNSPTQVGTDITWLSVSVGYNSVAVKTNGTLWALGGVNGNGQLGLNDTVNRSSPVQIGSDTNWSKIAKGAYTNHVQAIKTDGTLWTWGRNDLGQLGLNNRSQILSPTQVGTGTDWSNIASTLSFSAAIKTNGTLWMWGNNGNGQLGIGSTGGYRSSPVQVGTETDWQEVAIGSQNTLAIKTNGTLWSWGVNAFGQLGTNNVSGRNSPGQVGALSNWSKLANGWNFTFAIKTDGTLWGWGNNDYGQLGIGNTAYRSSPVQVGTETNWSKVEAGFTHTLATKTDGTLWSWGHGQQGQLGSGTNPGGVISPTQIGSGTTWLNPVAGVYNSMATRST